MPPPPQALGSNRQGQDHEPVQPSDRWLLVALLVAGLLCAVPLWSARTLPLMDLPQHLATVRILRDLHTPGWNLDAYYQLDLARTQYVGWYAAAVALSQLVSIETAARLLLTLYVVAVPFAVAAFLRAHRRDAVLAVLAAPLALNQSLWMGFVNYVSAIPLVLVWLAAVQRQLDEPRRRGWVALCVLPIAVWYLHAQALLHGAGLVVATVAMHEHGLRSRRGRQVLATMAPVLLLFGAWAAVSVVLASGGAWQASRAGHNVTDPLPRWMELGEVLREFPYQFGCLYRDRADSHLNAVLAVVGLGLALFSWRQRGLTQERKRVSWTPEVLAGLSLLLYFVLPTRYRWIYSLNTRTLSLTALLLLGTFARWPLPRRWTLAAGLGLASVACVLHSQRFAEFSHKAENARRLIAEIPAGQRGIGLIYRATSGLTSLEPYLHFAQYAVLEHGGMADFSFANFPQSPVTFRPPGPPVLPPRFEKSPDKFSLATQGAYYDWFLVRLAGDDLPPALQSQLGKRVQMVRRRADWVLLQKIQPAP